MGADVLNMSVKTSSVSKGETLIDTASTLNAMRPDILVVRHHDSGAAELLSRKDAVCAYALSRLHIGSGAQQGSLHVDDFLVELVRAPQGPSGAAAPT